MAQSGRRVSKQSGGLFVAKAREGLCPREGRRQASTAKIKFVLKVKKKVNKS